MDIAWDKSFTTVNIVLLFSVVRAAQASRFGLYLVRSVLSTQPSGLGLSLDKEKLQIYL